MRQLQHRFGLGAVALLAGSGAALADVTADQIWADWRNFSTQMGQTVTTGAETRSGDRLTITDATFTTAKPDVRVTTRFSAITLSDLGDGRVRITLSPEFTLSMKGAASTPDAVSMDARIRHSGLEIIASGDPDNTRYDYSAETLSATLENFATSGDDTQIAGSATLHGLTGIYEVSGADADTLHSTAAARTVDIDLTARSAGQEPVFTLKGKIDDLGGSSTSTQLAGLFERAEGLAGLPKDASLRADYHIGAGTYTLAIDNPEATATATVTTQDNALRLQFDATTLSYGAEGGPTTVVFSSPMLPVPEVTASMAASEASFVFPIGKSTEQQDFSLVTRLIKLTIGDDVWELFDPTSVLPRDPLTLIIDLAGKANWLVDPFNPVELNAGGDTLPAELHALTLSNLTLSALGAALTGTGAFTFDNHDLTTFPGFPKPQGEINLVLSGANGLIDKLISLGFLPQDQAMGARMMLGLFAQPAEQADTLTSKIEVRADGTVFANDQRLK